MLDFTIPESIYLVVGYHRARNNIDEIIPLIRASTVFNPHVKQAYLILSTCGKRLRIVFWNLTDFLDIVVIIHQGRLFFPTGSFEFRLISLENLERILRGDRFQPLIKNPLWSLK